MNKFRFTINILAIAIFTFAFASIAQAQATRTWVSGVGDDANPCSRTAPCKTFAGAISKTFINGEIDCLDEGGFGTVTITKSITIEGTYGSGFGSILASGTTGVNISVTASANDPLATVRLRNLSINGTGASGSVGTRTGIRGISINNATNVFIENCLITDFVNEGIRDIRTSAGGLFITDSLIRNCNGTGVFLQPSGTTRANIDNTRSEFNANGFVASGLSGAVFLEVRDSGAIKNATAGFAGSNGASVDIINCHSTYNQVGIDANGGATNIRVSRTNISRNTVNGLGFSGGTIQSYGNNEVFANTGNNGPFSPGGQPLQ